MRLSEFQEECKNRLVAGAGAQVYRSAVARMVRVTAQITNGLVVPTTSTTPKESADTATGLDREESTAATT